ncbi:hypothetical protein TNCV_4508411 [Trichonephila clavipes]|nr:hypothetical protein TNCV_4508411 [Trichonephila clavipes]
MGECSFSDWILAGDENDSHWLLKSIRKKFKSKGERGKSRSQNKTFRVMTNAPWYVGNDVIHDDLHMEPISNYITKLSRNVFKSIESHDNPIIKAQILFTYPHPKIKDSYSSTKRRNPLRPP